MANTLKKKSQFATEAGYYQYRADVVQEKIDALVETRDGFVAKAKEAKAQGAIRLAELQAQIKALQAEVDADTDDNNGNKD